ncbi:hypothetical protein CLV48_102148 [Cecembia rubra]|uniref:Uncharacterized protein n=1 Tax=Cecembia rubra TaxID=1485585 RepID=A0A2P8EA30_9BACT|nr:hypothetical protein CLV48_102148 [Cecembia rubra]
MMPDDEKSITHVRAIGVIRGQKNIVHELHLFPRKDAFRVKDDKNLI